MKYGKTKQKQKEEKINTFTYTISKYTMALKLQQHIEPWPCRT